MITDSPWYWNRVDLFDEVDGGAREMFFRNTTRHTFRKGQHVFRSDDDANQVFYLFEGMVRIYHLSTGGDPTIFWYCVRGELFGAGGITGSMNQAVNGQAISPSTVYALSRRAFEQMLKLHPQLSINALKLMGARLRLACDSTTDMRLHKTENRVARALLRLAHNCGVPIKDGIRLDAPITHQEVANMVGACRQTVTEVLHDFESHDYIAQRGRQIVILDPEALDVRAERESRAQEPRGAVSGRTARANHG